MNILEGINKIITKLGSDKKVDNITDGLNQISENIGGESGSGSGGGSSNADGCKIISVGTGPYPDLVPNAYFSSETDLVNFLENIYENKTPANLVVYNMTETGEYANFYHQRQYHFYENVEGIDDGFDIKFHDGQAVGGGYLVRYNHIDKTISFVKYADE